VREIGALLASVPSLPSILDPAVISNMLQSLIKFNSCGSLDVLAACLGMTRRSITTWSAGEVRLRLGGLCRLSFQLRVPLLDLIQGNISAAEVASLSPSQRKHVDAGVKTSTEVSWSRKETLSRAQTLEALVKAANEPIPPTLHRVREACAVP